METQVVYQISLVAAYIAGIVALFAPCCISYLFPAYLGNVFKERKQVLLMTFVFSLGIFVVMMPIVLGAKALQVVFFDLHDQTYIFGGIFMLFIAIISFLGIKLPMPRVALTRSGQKNDAISTFTLGIFSGIASACCAPVLIGVVALSSLSPSSFQALGVGAAYVLGMVTPLYLASLFIHKGNILQKPILKKKITEVKLGSKIYPVFVTNIIATAIFAFTGILMIWFASAGKLGTSIAEAATIKSINNVAVKITEFTSNVPILDYIFAVVVVYLMYKFIKKAFGSDSKNITQKGNYTCPMHPKVVQDKPGICPECGMGLTKN